jgi:hypothetical protein
VRLIPSRKAHRQGEQESAGSSRGCRTGPDPFTPVSVLLSGMNSRILAEVRLREAGERVPFAGSSGMAQRSAWIRCGVWLAAVVVASGLLQSPAAAQDSPPDSTAGPIPVDDQIRKFIEESVFQSLAIQTEIVTSDEYDTGMGFGLSVSHSMFDPGIRMKTSLHFWGASRDSNDVASLGIEESVMLEKASRPNLDMFTGVTAGYSSLEKDTLVRSSQGSYTNSYNTNRFNLYLTSGLRYWYHNDRSITFILNYVISRNTNELHLVFGLEFFKPLAREMRSTGREIQIFKPRNPGAGR